MKGAVQEQQRPRLERRLGKRFAFLSILGRGAAGTVYEVMNLRLGRKEALKLLADMQPEDFSERFSHEARISAAMDHPNIVKIFEFERGRGGFWYSMQFIDGPSLAQIMAAKVKLDDTAIARLAIPLLDALHYSHTRGVIHRDIKPGNILVNEEGRPFLTDFGIAKTLDSLTKTRTGTMLGTPAYVSPEQALGRDVDHGADIYSLGVTLYEALAGRLPFTADNSLQTVVMRLQEDPEPLQAHCPDVRPVFAAIIMRALEREPADRWASAAQMREALVRACDGQEIHWNRPFMDPQEVISLRRSLATDESTIVDLGGDGPWRTVYDPPTLVRIWHRIPWPRVGIAAGIALPAAIALLWGLRPRTAPGPAAPQPAVPSPPLPIDRVPPTLPAPGHPKPQGVETSRPSSPVPPQAPPRRAVTPPMLEETFPPEAKETCAGITVNLSLRVGPDGKVTASRVISRVPAECAKAAQDAGLRYRFKPALDAGGEPVEGVVAVAVILGEAP